MAGAFDGVAEDGVGVRYWEQEGRGGLWCICLVHGDGERGRFMPIEFAMRGPVELLEDFSGEGIDFQAPPMVGLLGEDADVPCEAEMIGIGLEEDETGGDVLGAPFATCEADCLVRGAEVGGLLELGRGLPAEVLGCCVDGLPWCEGGGEGIGLVVCAWDGVLPLSDGPPGGIVGDAHLAAIDADARDGLAEVDVLDASLGGGDVGDDELGEVFSGEAVPFGRFLEVGHGRSGAVLCLEVGTAQAPRQQTSRRGAAEVCEELLHSIDDEYITTFYHQIQTSYKLRIT